MVIVVGRRFGELWREWAMSNERKDLCDVILDLDCVLMKLGLKDGFMPVIQAMDRVDAHG